MFQSLVNLRVVNRPVGRTVLHSSLRERLRFKSRSIKSDTELPRVRQSSDISLKGAVLPERNDAEMGPANSIVLSSARGQHYFRTVEISLENARNLAENLRAPFLFSYLEHLRCQGGRGPAPSIEILPKTRFFSSVSVSF